jgi:uncharacterized protein (TIGR00730 family)
VQKLCVFCGSSRGVKSEYQTAAREVGELLAQHGITLVYGGGNVGLMGIVADAALGAGGAVIGVIPEPLVSWEVAHAGLTELYVVDTMHTRKARMADLADGFLALPGGFGTLDEFCEVLTWAQLGLHAKPCGLLNVAGFYDGLLAQLDRTVADGLLRPEHRALVQDDSDAARLLKRMRHHHSQPMPKWIDRDDR